MARCDTYAWGNCTRGACDAAPWIPDGLGDGGDWAYDYQVRGGQVTMIPTVGSVVCYCRGGGYSQWGHVAVVEAVYDDGSFLVGEMNFIALNQWDERHSSPADVCGFLLAPGMIPGAGAPQGRGEGGGGGALSLPAEVVNAWEALRWWSNDGYRIEFERQNAMDAIRSQIPL